ncbi:hypothetical protein V6C03_14475 [Methyloligella sp. 2.7D]|uniref:ubiquinone biosynthesis protein COQ9 n=1 Tax=unclassified Methyloligella TaxID=2625955 RepID=UPI00157D7F13|nr:hypothetical protein [Methyloligella sp. GL2]QKP77042.1 hypothetical protein HT051_05990 [Methyloligella sp. GL2]
MLNDFTNRSRAIRAAFELAETKPWHDIALAEIAAKAGLSLSDLRAEFDRKADLLTGFQKEVDRAVLDRATSGEDVSPKDRLLDAMMIRFEVMAPYRGALKRIVKDISCRPSEAGQLLPTALASQYWMLAAAKIPVSGPQGAMKVAGLAGVQGQSFRYWLEDDSPGFERTMAFIDRRLDKGERLLHKAEDACCRLKSLACCFVPKRKAKGETPAPDAPAPEPEGA